MSVGNSDQLENYEPKAAVAVDIRKQFLSTKIGHRDQAPTTQRCLCVDTASEVGE